MSASSDLEIAQHELSRERVRFTIEQLVEDYGSGIVRRSFDHGYYVADVDLLHALLMPVSFATAIFDVCEKLGVTAPWSVRKAIGADDLPPAAD